MTGQKKRKIPFLSLILLTVVLICTFQKMQAIGKELVQERISENNIREANVEQYVKLQRICKNNNPIEYRFRKSTIQKNVLIRKQTVSEKTTSQEKVVKKLGKVGKNYLNGALFIGDSRTATLAEYAHWKKTDFYVQYGLTIWTVMDAKIATQKTTGHKISVKQALGETQYKKIYIMLGVNELGRGTSTSFYKQYDSVVEQIRKLQPDAIIYIQSILHVTESKDLEKTYINNKEINKRNKKLRKLDNGEDVFYLKLNLAFDNSSHKLNSKYTSDGVHIKPQYIYIWKNYLLKNGIKF